MLVTGVQAVGAKGVSAIQGAVVDVKATTRTGVDGDRNQAAGAPAKKREPQPVVFHRTGVPMDQRPVALRKEHAATRYREDGGGDQPDAA